MTGHNNFKAKVLILDDNPNAREAIQYEINGLGESVESNAAETFEEAFKCLNQAKRKGNPFGFLVADLALGEKAVEEGIEWIREASQEFPELKIIAVSGKDTNASPVFETGAFAFFRKPHYQGLKETILYSKELEKLEKGFLDPSNRQSPDGIACFRHIVQKLPVGISVVDRRMRVLYMNEHQQELSDLQRLRGYKAGELCYEVFADGATETCPDCPVVNLFEGNDPPSSDIHMRRKGYHKIIAFPLNELEANKNVLAVVKVAVDVTSREEFNNFRMALEGELKLGPRILMVLNAIMSRGYKRARMLLKTDDGRFIESYQAKDDNLDDFEGYMEPVADFASIRQVLETGKPKIFEGYHDSKIPCWQRTEPGIPLQKDQQYGLMPMKYAGKAIGAIFVDNYEPSFHDPDITRTPLPIIRKRLTELKIFADEAAKAIIESKRMHLARQAMELLKMDREVFEKQMKGNDLFHTLLNNCIRIIQHQSKDSVIPKAGPSIYGHIMLSEGDWLERKTYSDKWLPDFSIRWHLQRDSKAFCVQAFNEKREIFFNNLEGEPNWKEFLKMIEDKGDVGQDILDKLHTLQSFVCIPLIVSGKVLGTLSLQSPERNLFNETAIDLVRAFVQRTSQAVETYFSMERIRRFSEMSKAMAKARALFNEDDSERSNFALLTCLTHDQGMAFNRAVYLARENGFLKPVHAVGPKNRAAGELLYSTSSEPGMPDLDKMLKGDILFDHIPEGLSKLPVQGLPTMVELCKKGESCLPDDVFKALDVQEIVFFPMKYKEQLEAAVLLDNFLSGKETSRERFDILRDSAIDYATFLKTKVMFRQIEKEDKQKGELLHVLAHRLRTDVSGPYLWIRKAIRDGSGLDKTKLSVIANKMWTTHTAINDVLRFSVIESDSLKKKASFADVNVDDLINSVLQEVSIDKSGRVHWENTKGLKVRADSEMLKHALLNLLDNAILYSKEDSAIEISVQPRYSNTVQIRIEIVNEPKVPIGKNEWQSMFKKFFRGENARFAKGTGLGLYVVDHIAMAHGGRVEALPVDNGRVCFAIMIPAADDEGRGGAL